MVYSDPITSLSDLKESIESHVRSIPQFMLLSTVKHTILRFQMVHLLHTMGYVTCTVTSQRSASLLKQFVIPARKARRCDKTTVFKQDDAPPHIGRCAKQLVRRHFGDERIISRQFPVAWPPRSSRLESLRFLALGLPQVNDLQWSHHISIRP